MTNPETQNPTGRDTSQGVFDLDPGYQDHLLRILYLMDMQSEIRDIHIGEVDRYGDQKQQNELIKLKINELCDALGIPPTAWHDSVIDCARTRDSYREPPLSQEVINLAKIDGTKIGSFISDHIHWALPYEMENEAEAAFDITLHIPDGRELFIRAEGAFETIYIGEDPETGEVEDSEIETTIGFFADIREHRSAEDGPQTTTA